MTIVSDDPTLWPAINSFHVLSYFLVAAFVGVTYDWVLTLGQEVELIWRQRWSLMTVLYLSVRYLGIISAALNMLGGVPTISLTDTEWRVLPEADHYLDSSGWIIYVVWNWTGIVAFPLLWVIIITRLYAMYQQSKKILIFLIITFLADNIFNGVSAIIVTIHTSGEEYILFGTYQCTIGYVDNMPLLNSIPWILGTVWEVLTLCLAAWIAVKHFRELRQRSTGGFFRGCFAVLMKTHILYFASFAIVSCFQLIFTLSPTLPINLAPLDTSIYYGVLQISSVVQLFVLGPRLILGVREYHARLVADSDAATDMTSIAFQGRVHISTGSGV